MAKPMYLHSLKEAYHYLNVSSRQVGQYILYSSAGSFH